MIDFIVKYWVQVLLGLIATFLGWASSRVFGYKKLRNALMVMQLDRIMQAHRYYTDRGYITVTELDIIEKMNESYRELGGNGTAKALMQDLETLPTRKEDQ